MDSPTPDPLPTSPARRKIFASTWPVLLLTLAALVLANVPGRQETQFELGPVEFIPAHTYAHGWPWSFARRGYFDETELPSCWALGMIETIDWLPLLGDVLVA